MHAAGLQAIRRSPATGLALDDLRRTRLACRFGLVTATTALIAACATDPAPLNRPTATIEDIMRALIDPAADAIWDAVVTDATAEGVIEIRPETADDWAALRDHAVTIADATNLLIVEGRRIAAPESQSDLPGVDLHPDAIQALVADDWESWIDLALELHETSEAVLDAVAARDLDALLTAGAELDVACENCHSRYW